MSGRRISPFEPSVLCASDKTQLLLWGLRTSTQTHIWHIGDSSQQYRFIHSYTPLNLQKTQEKLLFVQQQSKSGAQPESVIPPRTRCSSKPLSIPAVSAHPEGATAPKTTQINVWKWYLLSSSPWPLTKSTAALSNSANRISTKLNMSKY